MPFQIIRQDITKMHCDAIVNAAKNTLLGGGGVDGAIHRAAGPGLLEECRGLGGCKTGDAKITGGYDLPAKHVIHTVGPMWYGGGYDEETLLRSCYRRCLAVAEENGCESVAFPLISAGIYGYPKDEAMRIAVEEIGAFLLEHDMTVYLTVFGRDSFEQGSKLFANIRSYIDDHYAERQYGDAAMERRRRMESNAMPAAPKAGRKQTKRPRPEAHGEIEDEEVLSMCLAPRPPMEPETVGALPQTLEERLRTIDESFSEMLLRKIDEKGITDAQCYKKANIDRKLFSKIRSDPGYKPKKATALAFAIALELPMPEVKELLMKAGFALSDSSKFDIIVKYFIEEKNYNIFQINEALFAFDQSLLGGM